MLDFKKKTVDHGAEEDSNSNCPRNPIQDFGVTENQRKNQGHPDHAVFKRNQNTWKSSSDLKRLAVTTNSVKDHQQTLV